MSKSGRASNNEKKSFMGKMRRKRRTLRAQQMK